MLCCCCSILAFGQNMTQEIEKIIKGKQASVGVAIIHNEMCIRDSGKVYPDPEKWFLFVILFQPHKYSAISSTVHKPCLLYTSRCV